MNCQLKKELEVLINEFSLMADGYKETAKNQDSDFFEGFYRGRAGAYSVARDLLKEVLFGAEESR